VLGDALPRPSVDRLRGSTLFNSQRIPAIRVQGFDEYLNDVKKSKSPKRARDDRSLDNGAK
jgi:hypothetical protein